jgi:hypothetical protein
MNTEIVTTEETQIDGFRSYQSMMAIDNNLEKARILLSYVQAEAGQRVFLDIDGYVCDCLEALGLMGTPDGSADFTSIAQRIEAGIKRAVGEVFVMDDADLPVGEWLLERLAGQIREVCERLSLLLDWENESAASEVVVVFADN